MLDLNNIEFHSDFRGGVDYIYICLKIIGNDYDNEEYIVSAQVYSQFGEIGDTIFDKLKNIEVSKERVLKFLRGIVTGVDKIKINIGTILFTPEVVRFFTKEEYKNTNMNNLEAYYSADISC